jgi:hypothetical protein
MHPAELTTQIIVQMRPSERAYIEQVCEETGLTRSAVMRQLALGATFSPELHDDPAAVREAV